MKSENISYFKNVSLQEVKPHKDGLMLGWYDKEMECEYKMPVSYLLLAIGREPCLDFLNDNIKNNLKKLQEMEILHLIGDVKRGNYRQTAISVGDGIKCAMKVYKKLKEETR
jgi:thioredoxin reductase